MIMSLPFWITPTLHKSSVSDILMYMDLGKRPRVKCLRLCVRTGRLKIYGGHNEIQIFEGSDKFLRDFTYIDDVISVNKHFIENKDISGIFNCATGIAEAFSTIPEIMSEYYNFKIKEIPIPPQVIDQYQKFTRADLDKLRTVGKYNKPFISLSGGIEKYVDFWSTYDDNRIY